MSQSSTLTRCPHCDTRFRVTEEQLGIARGKVRCGNCMEVFNALEHSEAAASPARSGPREAPAPKQDTPAPAPGRFQQEEELIFEDDPEEDAAEGNYAGTKTSFDEDELSDSFLQFDEKGEDAFGDRDDEADQSIDESWAEAILDENESRSAANRSEPHQPERAPKPQPKPKPAPAPRPEPEPEPEREPEPAPEEFQDEPFSQRRTFNAPEPESDLSVSDDYTPDDFISTPPERPDPRDSVPHEPEESFAATRRMGAAVPYDDLRSEPIALDGGGRSWLRRSVWTIVIIGLIGVLVSQVAYFQLDRLSSIPELRPYYEQGCDLLGCELPPLVAIDRIQSQKLVVRTDPKKRDTLVVDAVLINQAGFEQPFPNIGLTFSNLNGDVVAQSLFEPDEYLSGDAGKMGVMPSQTPIRISITIRDPGRDAVNYNLTFIARGK